MTTLSTVLLIVLILLLVGALPQLGFHSGGYGPSGVITVLLIVLIVLALTGRL